MGKLYKYDTSNDLGKYFLDPGVHYMTQVHLVHDVKNDGRHKARLVADGHLTHELVQPEISPMLSLSGMY